MPDPPDIAAGSPDPLAGPLLPVDQAELASALAYSLRFDERGRPRRGAAWEMAATLLAEQLVAQLERGTHSAKAAGQVAVLRLTAGLLDHALASASTAFACSSKSIVLGSKGSPTHWTISAWLSCFGSAIATRNSA
jgi:hypothetical protein